MKYFLLIIFTALSININAQDLHPYKVLYDQMYFKAYISFIDKEENYKTGKNRNAYHESIGILYSFIGKYDKAIQNKYISDKNRGFIPDSLQNLNLSDYRIDINKLCDLYKKYNVVMFNESHHYSQHRAFLYSQLDILKSLGFNQLALETIGYNDQELIQRGFSIKKTGYYTNDPVYANVIRKAIELGFTIIPYESETSNFLFREKAQAKNLYNQYDQKKGKLIVYAGYGHIAENDPFLKMMGQHFKKKIKEDILTISQFTHYYINPIFPDSSTHNFFLQKDKTNYVDYYLYAKPKPNNSNIPYWYKWMNFKTKPLNKVYKKGIDFPTLIQLHNINEKDAVPVYQYMIEQKEDVLIAYPKEGDYILKVIDKNGESTYKIKL